MTAGEFNDLRNFRFGDIVGENAADADTVTVDMQHDFNRRLATLVENLLEDVNDELHGRVVVVEDEHLVEARLLGLGARFRDDPGAVVTVPRSLAALAFSVTSVFHRGLSQAYIGTLILIDKGPKQSPA